MKNLSGLFRRAATVLTAGALLCSACTLANEPGGNVAYTVSADGTADTANTTAIAFAFSGAVSGLTAGDITLANGTGAVTKGALTGEDSNRSLGITVTTAGTVKVKITKAGIEDEEKTVTVHKAASGNDDANSEGDGNGAGDGNGEGNGDGSGAGDDDGSGNGDDDGDDDNSGNGDGDGSGEGDGDNNGEGNGDDDNDDGEDKELELTPVIEFASEDYSSGTMFDDGAWDGQGTDTESWTLNVTEQGTVYFAVYKTEAQTITSTDEVNVSIATSGSVDGLAASDELAVFTVKTADLVFDGGTRSFTLNVNETNALPRTVNVTLNVAANTTGAAVFKTRDTDGTETMERLGGDAANFDGLVSAFTWVEYNAVADTEYTIRVEKDETDVPYLGMGANNAPNVTLRFRGINDDNGPKTLTPIHFATNTGTPDRVNIQNITISNNSPAFITIGGKINHKMTFILGNNIAIQGHERNAGNGKNYGRIFDVYYSATLVLEPGSAITGFKGPSAHITLVEASPGNTNLDPTFHGYVRIEGGSITDCNTYFQSNAYRGMIKFGSVATDISPGAFYVAGNNALVLSGNNTDYLVGFGNTDNRTVDLAAGASLP